MLLALVIANEKWDLNQLNHTHLTTPTYRLPGLADGDEVVGHMLRENVLEQYIVDLLQTLLLLTLSLSLMVEG